MFEDGAGPGAGSHPVLDAAGLVSAACSALLSSAATSLSLPEVRRAAADLQTAAAQLEAARLHVVRLMLEREDDPVRPGAQTAAWMTHTLRSGRGAARTDIAAARATDPHTGDLPAVGAALAEGAISRRHVDVAVRALGQLPTGLVRERGAEVDALLVSHARAFSPPTADELARHLVATVAPDGLEAFADEASERRFLSVRPDRTGMVRLEGQLEPVGGAVVATVLDHLARPDRALATPGKAEPVATGEVDRRTSAQRLADATVQMAHLAAAQLQLDAPALEPTRVVIHCTPEQLTHPDPSVPCGAGDRRGAGGAEAAGAAAQQAPATQVAHRSPGLATCELTGPVSSSALHRHACDAVLQRVVLDRAGAVLRLESAGRLATPSQRRALAARDGGCAWPACSAPASWTEAHHVLWWSRGGPTVLDNLVLLCPHHHTEIHREHWAITMRDGVPWFTPPRWVDPDQVPVRNSVPAAVQRTRRAGQRLLRGGPLAADDLAPPGRPPASSRPPPAAA